MLDRAKAHACETLARSDEWVEACGAIEECSGLGGDKLEEIRVALTGMMARDRTDVDVEALNSVLKGFKKTSGSAKNWDPSDLERLRKCIFAFKEKVKIAAEICSLSFGPVDDDLAARLPLLKDAFYQTREHIAAEKVREKVLDFNDLERYALKVLEHEEARRHYSLRWTAFLIDEFQDTNPVQAEILSRLTRDAVVSIVGDEKQSIYGFRGADVGVFTKVRKEIVDDTGGTDVILDRTFRAHDALVRKMNEVFGPVLGDLHQELYAEKAATLHNAPFLRLAAVAEQKGSSEPERRVLEARYIADRIEELHLEGVPYSHIAILARKWEPLNTYLDVLSARGIPAVNAGGGSLLATIEARDIYSLLQFAADPHDDIALVSVLRSPFFAFNDKVLYEAARSLSEGSSWWDLISARPEFSAAVGTLREILETSKHRSAETVVRVADRLTGYSAVIANLPQGPRRLADLEGVFDVLRKLALRGRGDVFGVVRYIRELYKTDIALPRPAVDPGEAVVLMSIHRAKGLEWPVIFVPDLSSGSGGGPSSILIDPDLGVAFKIDDDENNKQEAVIFGLIKARRKMRELEEARRILYVAITRAKDKVFLTSGKEKGNDMDILKPGLDAAGIEAEVIPYSEDQTIAPAPGLPPEPENPSTIDVDPIRCGLTELPVTALSAFAACPARFRWEYVERHPGVHEGTGSGMRIGTLTHLALEHQIASAPALGALDPDASNEEIEQAISLANAFRGNEYKRVNDRGTLREMRFVEHFGPIRLTGVADLVGDDFVLDYKTDAVVEPETHRFQLWAYAKALGKSRAYIAYLAHDELYEFTSADLAEIEEEAVDLLDRIAKGDLPATPSAHVCRFCAYREVCEFRYNDNAGDEIN
jgi:ATP-dependent helicase/nuclease subunit A